jgi:thymidylate synthase (FAD)
MKLIKPYTEILTPINGEEILKTLEKVARTCYKSEDKITEDSAEKMVKTLISKGHEAMIEFFDITVKFVCDRGVSHELVRHRIASFAQESTRYVNYSKGKYGGDLTFIIPE